MAIRKEASGVGLDLRKLESRAGINTIGRYASRERPGHAADGAAELVVADWVREGEARGGRWTRWRLRGCVRRFWRGIGRAR